MLCLAYFTNTRWGRIRWLHATMASCDECTEHSRGHALANGRRFQNSGFQPRPVADELYPRARLAKRARFFENLAENMNKFLRILACRYFVVANAMVFAFSAAALAAVRRRSAVVPVMVGDLVAMALLFSAVGAAAQFGLLGERGNAHVRWAKVCDVYGPFCERAMAAVVVALIAAFADLVLLMLTILTIHKASSYY
jgi:uncharacterized protein (TIGR01569 family)